MVKIATESLKKIKTIQKQYESDRKVMDEPWKDVTKYLNPLLEDWDSESDPTHNAQVKNNMKDLHDNTGMISSNDLADGVVTYAFSRSAPWYRLGNEMFTGGRVMDGKWLQYAEDHGYSQFSRSNFYDEGRAFVKICADYGTAVMTRHENKVMGMPVYKARHPKRVYIAMDEFGNVDTLFYYEWYSAQNCVQRFGIDNLPEQIKTAYSNNSAKNFKIWNYIFPFDKYDLDFNARGTRRDVSYYSLYMADIDSEHPLADGVYRSKPFYGWRWSRSLDGGPWGIDSPGLLEISTIKQLQGFEKNLSRSVELATNPPLKATVGLSGRIKYYPHGITELEEGEDFAAARITGDLQNLDNHIERKRQSVERSYMTEFFLMLTRNLERVKTATEVDALQSEQAAKLSAFYGRLVYEFLEPVVEDMIEGEIVAGRLEIPGDMQGQEVKIDMVSPLAQLQKRRLRLTTTDQAIREIISISQFKPEILDNYNLDNYARKIAEYYNIDKTIIRDMMDVEKMRQARVQAQQAALEQQAQMERGKAEAESYSKMAKAPEQGSPAAEAMGVK